MKSMRTMMELAKGKAEAMGVRIWQGSRCGYFVTVGELLALYAGEGFNSRGSAMRRHVRLWMEMDEAVLEGSDEDEGSALWFPCPKGKETLVMVRSEQCGGRYVTEIRRTEWPALRRMHGIQEAIA